MFDHHVTVDMTPEGSRTLAAFIESVPASWQADFYELFQGDPTGQLMIQYFRTPQPIDLFVAASLTRKLSGIVEHGFNKKIEDGIHTIWSIDEGSKKTCKE
jgi:hypothetical protein